MYTYIVETIPKTRTIVVFSAKNECRKMREKKKITEVLRAIIQSSPAYCPVSTSFCTLGSCEVV